MASTADPEHFRAIVDMGSNGIRFSITDLSPSTSRIMPTIYQDRTGISLYDAQWSTGQKAPIPDHVTADVVRALLRFKRTCGDFKVKSEHVRILATEATRQAVNSEDYRARIKEATGWTVEMLPKEDEGRVGAMGVVSSFSTVKGLMMDLGGGSTQITWLVAEKGTVRMSEAGSVSLPYGAAALMRRLGEAQKLGGREVAKLKDEITSALHAAVKSINIPQEILDTKNTEDGLTLYLSGGGFRGWGFLLMSQHPVSPYPIPIINGFKASISAFQDIKLVKATAAEQDDVFRVSERRASQVPAVALLVGCMLEALPVIGTIRFAQGGVREGSLFTTLDPEIKEQYPLVTGTIPHTSSYTPALLKLLYGAVPSSSPAPALPTPLITALAQSLYLHISLNKDLKSAAALRSTTTGALAGVHGASHDERAALAVMLCERWGGLGDLPPGEASFYQRLLQLLGAEKAWWCIYFGRVAAVVDMVFPAGVVGDDATFNITADWSDTSSDVLDAGDFKFFEKEKDKKKYKDKKHNKDKSASSATNSEEDGKHSMNHKHAPSTLQTTFDFGADDNGDLLTDGVVKALRNVWKLGKRKNWPDVGEGQEWGCKIFVKIRGGDGSGVRTAEEE